MNVNALWQGEHCCCLRKAPPLTGDGGSISCCSRARPSWKYVSPQGETHSLSPQSHQGRHLGRPLCKPENDAEKLSHGSPSLQSTACRYKRVPRQRGLHEMTKRRFWQNRDQKMRSLDPQRVPLGCEFKRSVLKFTPLSFDHWALKRNPNHKFIH